MKKKIEDYLHLYIGNEVIGTVFSESGANVKSKIETVGIDCCSFYGLADYYYSEPEYKLQLLLRPLSDMTINEGFRIMSNKFIYPIIYVGESGYHEGEKEIPEKIKYKFNYDKKNSKVYYESFPVTPSNAETTRIMLEMGFDLFGLIESGLAIDKTLK